MRLYIANKNYSSWSFRPWIAFRAAGIEFEEILIPFDDDARNPEFARFSPTQKVPVLEVGEQVVWESLAILEYAADHYPQAQLWPADSGQRATARAVACEMHAGFAALRGACPMNFRRPVGAISVSDAVKADVARIESIWADCLDASGGPFLFGRFGNADAMFAPVVNRLEKYALSDHDAVQEYSAAMKQMPAWRQWEQDALAETWIVPADEA